MEKETKTRKRKKCWQEKTLIYFGNLFVETPVIIFLFIATIITSAFLVVVVFSRYLNNLLLFFIIIIITELISLIFFNQKVVQEIFIMETFNSSLFDRLSTTSIIKIFSFLIFLLIAGIIFLIVGIIYVFYTFVYNLISWLIKPHQLLFVILPGILILILVWLNSLRYKESKK